MIMRYRDEFLLSSSIALGLGVSTGHPLGMMAAAGMPLACLALDTREGALMSAFSYYAAALWPMITGLEAYWKSEIPIMPIVLWVLTAILLSVPWAIAWTSNRVHCLWRAPLALLATIVPPLGIIGLASPVTGAGFLFPGADWVGLALIGLLPGVILSSQALESRHRWSVLYFTIASCTAVGVAARILYPHDADRPAGWAAVDTHLGDVSQPFRDFVAAQFIQKVAAVSRSRVVIFPESVVPRWSEATKAFWGQSLDQCRKRGQMLAIGAELPANNGNRSDKVRRLNELKSYDFDAAIGALKSMNLHPGSHGWSQSGQIKAARAPADNTMLILGAESAAFYQRVPVPLAMWRPFSRDSVPLRLGAPGVLLIDHQRAAVLICYEQMLTYPILTSMLQHPTVIVGISNTFWISHTTIPRYQANALRSWARLFRLPYLLAVNS
jgi:hypothetical protein